jgi:hypothetical protein
MCILERCYFRNIELLILKDEIDIMIKILKEL